jgi:hypothetical protein
MNVVSKMNKNERISYMVVVWYTKFITGVGGGRGRICHFEVSLAAPLVLLVKLWWRQCRTLEDVEGKVVSRLGVCNTGNDLNIWTELLKILILCVWTAIGTKMVNSSDCHEGNWWLSKHTHKHHVFIWSLGKQSWFIWELDEARNSLATEC